MEDRECHGAYILKGKEVITLLAKATILATGGGCQIFSRTTNPPVSTGDGMAIAFRAGAVMEDMEFIQFHPTSLYSPLAPQFLISEAMRGEGAILRNIEKERFMEDYDPMAELAPRDIVSRAIISEMVKTRSDHVYIDVTHLGKEFLKKRFPRIYSTCLMYDIDITKELVPVSPAAHYMMGGVKTDTKGGTSIKGLYAAGEVACTGVHGANRLASNSLLEGLVYGARAGKTALTTPLTNEQVSMSIKENAFTARPFAHRSSIPDHEEIRHELRKHMWEKVGIIRCGESLGYALEKLRDWSFIQEITPLTRRELELKNMQVLAHLITEASLQRKGSVGAHYRSDYPEKGTGWEKHIAWRNRNGELTFELI